MHSSTIHVPDELIVLVFAYELFDLDRVFIVVVLPSSRRLRTTTSLDFLSLFIFYYFLLLICFFVFLGLYPSFTYRFILRDRGLHCIMATSILTASY